MTPRNSGSTGCVNASSSNCIVWEGPSIDCLGICHGESLSTVVHLLGEKVCKFAEGQDLSTLDLSCLIDIVEPTDRTLAVILQLLLDNQCKLKELIDGIETGGSDFTVSLNMKCLTKYDEFENVIPQDLNQTLQSIVNQICTSKDDIANIKADIQQLEQAIDDLTLDPYVEPEYSTCVNAVPKPATQIVPLLADDLCTYKNKVGTTIQINGAIGRQGTDIAEQYTSTPGFIANAVALAQTVNNQWIVIQDLLNRITVMEQTCCAPACDKVKLGFVPEFDFDAKTVTLSFESGAGTNIPMGFEDCGTKLTITDSKGFSKEFGTLAIAQGDTTAALNLSGFTQGLLNFNFKTKFCLKDTDGNTVLVCQDCFGQEIEYSDASCCSITNSSGSTVTIVYQNCAPTT